LIYIIVLDIYNFTSNELSTLCGYNGSGTESKNRAHSMEQNQ